MEFANHKIKNNELIGQTVDTHFLGQQTFVCLRRIKSVFSIYIQFINIIIFCGKQTLGRQHPCFIFVSLRELPELSKSCNVIGLERPKTTYFYRCRPSSLLDNYSGVAMVGNRIFFYDRCDRKFNPRSSPSLFLLTIQFPSLQNHASIFLSINSQPLRLTPFQRMISYSRFLSRCILPHTKKFLGCELIILLFL